MATTRRWENARARQALYRALREGLEGLGYLEVETPALVPTPGLEPHIDAFEVGFVPQLGVGRRSSLYLHTSPEYAMKRLLAEARVPLFQICKVFRNGEVSPTHNPEFTMLEFYRPFADYRSVMEDLERLLCQAEAALRRGGWVVGPPLFNRLPFEVLTVREAMLRFTGLDLGELQEGASLAGAARRAGVFVGESTSFEEVFFRVFLERVEPQLGRERPTYLVEYPASMASLARLKPADPRVAERVELYAGGLELANGFSELVDADEQRARLVAEQEQRRAAGRPAYPLDEPFLEALGKMPPAGGIAVGLDRVLMLLVGASDVGEVLLFPAKEFV